MNRKTNYIGRIGGMGEGEGKGWKYSREGKGTGVEGRARGERRDLTSTWGSIAQPRLIRWHENHISRSVLGSGELGLWQGKQFSFQAFVRTPCSAWPARGLFFSPLNILVYFYVTYSNPSTFLYFASWMAFISSAMNEYGFKIRKECYVGRVRGNRCENTKGSNI